MEKRTSSKLSFEAVSCLFFYRVLRLLPGMGGGSPARRGAWGERGSPSTPPAPPYSPFCGSVEGVSLVELYPARRVSLGRRREPSRLFRPGDVRACCGAPSALRATGIAFAPAPSLRQSKGRRGELCRAAAEEGRRAKEASARWRRKIDEGDCPGGGQGAHRAACGSLEIRVKIEADKKYNKITLSSPRPWGCF